MRVLIVGAGPTGLTAAVELARRGITPTIIDKRETPSGLSRAVGILPRSLDLLQPSGVTERLVREGIRLREAVLHFGADRALSLPFGPIADEHPHGFILAIAQDRTEAALRDAFSDLGGDVEYGCELTDVRLHDSHIVAITTRGERTFDYVIGADGVDSATRESLGLDFPGHDLPETWSIADVDVSGWAHAEAFTICLLPRGRVAVVAPLERERCRVISNTEDALATLPLEMNITNIRRQGQFRISIRQVREYRVGRVLLAGDAAHCHSPVGGRGMNLGIADAADLAGRLAIDDPAEREAALAGYTEARRRAGEETIALSERARRLLASPGVLKRPLTRLACRVIDRSPSLQRRLARRILDL
jgi:2-polyprenyl-6-methoxyphenol hydroxylase-like FAD-dependent oxidoreductase